MSKVVKYVPTDPDAELRIRSELTNTYSRVPQKDGPKMSVIIGDTQAGAVQAMMRATGVSYLSIDGEIKINRVL